MVLTGTNCKEFFMKRKSVETSRRPIHRRDSEDPDRTRVLQAAFSAFQQLGYAGASTLEIATRAKVSKRELYTLFSNRRACCSDGKLKTAANRHGT
jgi:AcrR family transcriptional regulator